MAVGWLASFGAVLLWGKRETTASADVIVVLGAAQYVGRPSPVLRARLDHALTLWRRGRAPRLLLTGGKGVGDTMSEAEVGRNYLVRRGIPATVLLLEQEGRSTEQSIEEAARILRGEGLRRAIFVSDPFHMLRIDILARGHGLDPLGSPTRTSPISASRLRALGYLASESLKVPLTVVLALGHVMGI